jgi:DNA-binding beta-propeller fold protein YncE
LLSPFGLAITPSGHLFVLDSDRGQVIEYAAGRTGSAVPQLASDTVIGLLHARDLALDAAGHILVADPASNSVVTLAADLTLLHQQPNRAANGVDLFEQPDAVAAGPNGSIYVVDSQNNQLKQYSSGWTLLRSWPLIATDTLHAPHVLPLSGGRVLVSDPPDGKLLLFTATSNLPRAFTVAIQPGSPAVPLGLARSGPSTVLVTCNGSNQVLEVRVAGL